MNPTASSVPSRGLILLLSALATLGPFCIDTYLPAFPAIAEQLHTTDVAVQQTLTFYLIPFAVMMLWHGALSDSLGRRRVILVSLVLFVAATLVCALATSIEMLWLGRALQGLTAGAGSVVGRAMVRDLYEGVVAQKVMAAIAVLFAIAPAVAPMIGGWALLYASWQSIFFGLAVIATLLFIASWRWLPETLPKVKRQSLHPVNLARGYRMVFNNRVFRLIALATAFNFSGMFIYVLAAPVFLILHLHLSAQDFAYLFMPVVAGMMLGSLTSGKLAGKVPQMRIITLGYLVMAMAAVSNVVMNLLMPPTLPWVIVPMAVFACGMAIAMPNLQLIALDMFPERRGMTSSCIGAVLTGLNAFTSALLVPLLWDSTLYLALGMAGFLSLGGLTFVLTRQFAKNFNASLP